MSLVPLFLALAIGASEPQPEAPVDDPVRSFRSLSSSAGSPWVIPKGQGTIGVFRPLTVGIGHKTDLTTTGLVSLVAPRVELRHTLKTTDRLGLGLRAGLGVPTWGLRLLQGTLLPPDEHIPWVAVAGLGPVAGWRRGPWKASLGIYARLGIPFEEGTFSRVNLPWFDPMVAPVVEGWSLQTRAVLDWQPSPTWQVTADCAWQVPAGPDLNARLFLLYAVGSRSALGLGVAAASEAGDYGRRDLLKPIGDLQLRW